MRYTNHQVYTISQNKTSVITIKAHIKQGFNIESGDTLLIDWEEAFEHGMIKVLKKETGEVY